MINYLLITILINSSFTWLTAHLFQLYIIRFFVQQEPFIKKFVFDEIKRKGILSEVIQEFCLKIDLERQIENFLNSRIEKIMHRIASQVPMGDYLLAGAVGKKIKGQVDLEITLMLPELQDYLTRQIIEQAKIEDLVEEKIQKFDFSHSWNKIKKKALKKLTLFKILLTLLAAIIGVIEFAILLFFR